LILHTDGELHDYTKTGHRICGGLKTRGDVSKFLDAIPIGSLIHTLMASQGRVLKSQRNAINGELKDINKILNPRIMPENLPKLPKIPNIPKWAILAVGLVAYRFRDKISDIAGKITNKNTIDTTTQLTEDNSAVRERVEN
jgi:hypothetical protein